MLPVFSLVRQDGCMTDGTQGRTPRERARLELTREIKDAARRQLSEHGASALSLRAVARELGLGSVSALYRYFPGRDALLTALIVDAYGALADAAEAAEATVHRRTVLTRWLAICHGVRNWAVAHPHEYGLIFGNPVPGYAAPPDTVEPARRVPVLLSELLSSVEATGGYDSRQHLSPPRSVRHAVRPLLAQLPPGAPDDLVVGGLMAWTYLFGAVSFDVFGHRRSVIDDDAAFFDHEMRRIALVLGLTARGISR